MRVTRFERPPAPEELRALVPRAADVGDQVGAILREVRAGGDAAVRRLTARFDGAEVPPERLRVDPRELEAALATLERPLLDGLETALANVRALARAQLGEGVAVELPEGQRIEIAELPVRRAAACVPAARAPLPSSLVMCAATARVAGVEQLAVCATPRPDGSVHPTILAACALCGVSELYRMGGAQAVGALAYGTESVPPVDVIAGPGGPWVQEAKRQVVGQVAIDGIAGPSELVAVVSAGADAELAALDILAQAEHGPDSLLAVISPDGAVLDEVEREVDRRLSAPVGDGGGVARARAPASIEETPLAVVRAPDARAAVGLADAVAPEHVQLVGAEVEALAPAVRSAGCLFVGREAGTAFGDYVAGSNHVLPTGGAARFQGALSVATFRRRMARVTLPGDAARRLAPAGVALAAAEGFPLHGESMARRA